MKIIRNGQEFELTREELYDAYREMEHKSVVNYIIKEEQTNA